MKRLLALAVIASLMALVAPAPAATMAPADADNYLFAGGGTNLSNGFFFPGTATCDRDGCTMLGGLEPLEIAKGSNITFTNTDASAVTNGHRIVSLKRKKRTGAPKFFSDQVDGPDSTTIITKKLKPGLYYYMCTTHFGMYGAIKVTKM